MATTESPFDAKPDWVITMHDSTRCNPIPVEIRLRKAIKAILRQYGFEVTNIKPPNEFFQGTQPNNRDDGNRKNVSA